MVAGSILREVDIQNPEAGDTLYFSHIGVDERASAAFFLDESRPSFGPGTLAVNEMRKKNNTK